MSLPSASGDTGDPLPRTLAGPLYTSKELPASEATARDPFLRRYITAEVKRKRKGHSSEGDDKVLKKLRAEVSFSGIAAISRLTQSLQLSNSSGVSTHSTLWEADTRRSFQSDSCNMPRHSQHGHGLVRLHRRPPGLVLTSLLSKAGPRCRFLKVGSLCPYGIGIGALSQAFKTSPFYMLRFRSRVLEFLL